MKQNLLRLVQTRYRLWFLSTLALLAIPSFWSYASPTLLRSDEQLFQIAHSAYSRRDFLRAAMYLTAYIERSPDLIRDNPEHAAQVDRAWNFSQEEVKEQREEISRLRTALDDCNRLCSNGDIGSITQGLTRTPPSLDVPSYAVPRSFPMVCRGGGTMSFDYVPSRVLSGKHQIWIRFEKGLRGVGEDWESNDVLKPGECSWIDRAIHADEPGQLVVPHAAADPSAFRIVWSKNEVRFVGGIRLIYLEELQDPVRYAVFGVYNDGEGTFIVTHAGLRSPSQQAPAHGSVFNQYPRSTTLRWVGVPDAAKYRVEIDFVGQGEKCPMGKPNYSMREVTSTSHTFDFVGAQPGCWRVWAVYSDGMEGLKSDWWGFRYTR